jgi:hypothetical protein
MDFLFSAQQIIRSNALKAIEQLSMEQIYAIPEGYNNNIAWNLAHMVATPQILCYKLAKLAPILPEDFINRNKKDSSPRNWDKPEDLNLIKEYFNYSLQKQREDYAAGKFNEYTEYKTSAGVILTGIEEAMIYNYGHENLHYGVILAMRKLV